MNEEIKKWYFCQVETLKNCKFRVYTGLRLLTFEPKSRIEMTLKGSVAVHWFESESCRDMFVDYYREEIAKHNEAYK